MSTFVGIPTFSNLLWVAIENRHFLIAIPIFLRTPSFRIQGVPMNTLAPMKICPGVFQVTKIGCRGTSFVDLLCFFCLVFFYTFVRVCLIVNCGRLLGKGRPLGSRLWCLTVSLMSLSHWYPGSGVVLDCIDS